MARFDGTLISRIKTCIETATMRVIWNGDLTDSFSPTRGIRQEDSLSPYLFVLCMEPLSHLIQDYVNMKQWCPVKLGRRGPPLSHLFFADGIFLFAEATLEQAYFIKEILDVFCAHSGQKVSSSKLVVFFSKNVSSRLLGFNITFDLGKYLGHPLIHGSRMRGHYQDIVSKAKAKLASWKGRHLSMAGHLTLAKSVLASFPVYNMQISILPTTVLHELDKIVRDFLWGSTPEARKLHLVGWDSLCSPKSVGGLGLHQATMRNFALVTKLGWRMLIEGDKLWVRVLKGKYGWNTSVYEAVTTRVNCTNTWRAIVRVWPAILQAIRWKVGHGRTILF